MSSRRRPGATCDFEELRPGFFLIHNPALGPTLSGDGDREGDRFQLTTWRRDGLLARLRMRGFVVATLADQIDNLALLDTVVPPGAPLTRALGSGERISYFAGSPPGWHPAPAADDPPQSVLLRVGWIIRRRHGRGPGDYYRVEAGGALSTLNEDAALLAGYAQAQLVSRSVVALSPSGDLADLPLPSPYRTLLGRIATRGGVGWRVAPESRALVAALLGRLGLKLTW